ncbi:MAG TPA: serine/threonine-protein kinase [Planctomycetaceae bacterium]|nr:serine/threonine-protein kinase [Planctomycetaceae bacterium]
MADEIIIDDYMLVNHIATGGSTQVWEATDKGSGGERRYAMKLLLPEALLESEQRSVLKHEAKLAEKFDHVNLVRFYKLVLSKKRGYILMEYFRAPNLKTQLQNEMISVQARLPRLIEQICSVLGYLHGQGWVHRDIKPDNILFNKASELRLIDFSLTTRAAGAVAKMLGSKQGSIQGTRTYIPPEAILKAPVTPQSDIYSLGITLFEVLTGEPPYKGTSPDDLLKKHLTGQIPEPSAFNPNVTPELDRMITKMLSKKAAKRQKDTHEVLAEFRNLKPFKEDVIEVDRRRKVAEAERYKTTLDKAGRLDSRADHERQQYFKANPDLAKDLEPKVPGKIVVPASGKAAPAKPAAAPAPAKAAATPAKPAPAGPQPARPQQPAAQQPARPQPVAQQAAPQQQRPPQQMPQQPMHQPQMPMHPGYAANPYGYPGYAQNPYQMPGYPGGGQFPQQGYPQQGYPQAPPQYPGAGYPQGYPPQQMPQQQMPPQQMPQQQMPGQPPGYPGAPGPYGAAPYGSQMRMPTPGPQPPQQGQPQSPPGAPPRPVAQQPRPQAPQPNAGAQPNVAAQQQLLQQMMGGQPAPAPPGRPPVPAQPAQPKGPAKDLPLMDQLPPVK